MNKRLISVFVFALTVSAGAAFVLYQLISSKVTAGAASHPTTKSVFVASRDLQPGALITERDISKQDYINAVAAQKTAEADTAVAHLAGALGKPVWILLPDPPDFMSMIGREDSLWYPTARLFRQSHMDDWGDVIAKVATEWEQAIWKAAWV